ncbi:MAG TPA: zf-HC2 domain-containing protein, partial [Vicinamibacterales bacterium]|nr:zf-HC2 domain-containing protein [Vicinamibacterales bacterium]
MDCTRFDRRLDALLEGTCTPEQWREAEAHATSCPRCRSLIDAMAGAGGGRQDEAEAEALTRWVLGRTSGGSCAAARDRLCDLVDQALAPVDRELVEGHLAGCGECASLAAALERAMAVLPGFASLEPPRSLFPAVLASTSRRAPEPTLADRVTAWLGRLAARPRISLEAAYALTLVIALLVGDPVAAFRETSSRGFEYAQPRVEQVLERVAGGRLEGARALAAGLADGAIGLSAAGESGPLARAAARFSGAWGWVRAHLLEPLRLAAAQAVSAVRELLAPNPDGARRVIQTTE